MFRSNASLTNNQNLIQSLREDLGKVRTEKENIQKDLDAKIIDIQEKVKTITQVKKIGRRYKTQYEELKAQQDKVFRSDFCFICILYMYSISFMYIICIPFKDNLQKSL